MTLSYKLFGVPRTLEEFTDKVKRNGYEQVSIRIAPQIKSSGGSYLAVLQAGNIEFIYDTSSPPPYTEGYPGSRGEGSGLKDALEATQILKKLGLVVLFNNQDAEESLEERLKEHLKLPKPPRAAHHKNHI